MSGLPAATAEESLTDLHVTSERDALSPREGVTRTLLIASVRLRVVRICIEGGPDPRALRESNQFAEFGAEPLKTAKQFNLLAEAIAHLAFAPDGCRAFGLRFEAAPLQAERDERPPLPPTKKQHRYWQARQDALQEAERTVLSWNNERPRTGYQDIYTNVISLLEQHYPLLDDVERVLLACAVRRAVFEPLLEEYEALYGGNLRQVWIAMQRRGA